MGRCWMLIYPNVPFKFTAQLERQNLVDNNFLSHSDFTLFIQIPREYAVLPIQLIVSNTKALEIPAIYPVSEDLRGLFPGFLAFEL